jgi:hypothetical protein
MLEVLLREGSDRNGRGGGLPREVWWAVYDSVEL